MTKSAPPSEPVLLVLIALASGPAHGYAIIRDVEERSDEQLELQPGALYRILKRLLESGQIAECERPATAVGNDDRRRYYRLTAAGRAVMREEVDRMARLVRAVRLAEAGKRPRLA